MDERTQNPSIPAQVDELDRLRIENYTVRIELLKTRMDLFRSHLEACHAQLRAVSEDMHGYRAHLDEKYGIDPTKEQIALPSGQIVRTGGT